LAHDVLRVLANPAIGGAWLDDIERRLAGLTHSELEPILPRISLALEKLRPLVLAPDEREGRRIAQGMARVTQAAIMAESAQWRIQVKDDRTALVAAELVTRTPLVAETSADMLLEGLAYGTGDAPAIAQRAA
jgi:hypothetical protein